MRFLYGHTPNSKRLNRIRFTSLIPGCIQILNEYGNLQIENLFTPINMAFTASICTKPTITQQSFIDIYTEVYTNLTKNVECTGKIPFAPLNYIWLSLHRFLQNS